LVKCERDEVAGLARGVFVDDAIAGLSEELRFHDLRYAFASMAAAKGVPINVLSAAMGHADIGVTLKTYTHLYDRAKAEDAFRPRQRYGNPCPQHQQ
jgi:integrase